MPRVASDRFTVTETQMTVTRKCPFCGGPIEDALGRDINFIVHLGSPTPKHQTNWAWANYITTINHV